MYLQNKTKVTPVSYNKSSPFQKSSPIVRDYKIDDISLNTHMNRFKFKPYITNIYIYTHLKKVILKYIK